MATCLVNGDSVVLIKDQRSGSSTTLKVGTRVKSIRLNRWRSRGRLPDGCRQFHAKACYLVQGVSRTAASRGSRSATGLRWPACLDGGAPA